MHCYGRGVQSSQYFNLPDAVPATVSESSVESFLKGVRRQANMKDEKREGLLKIEDGKEGEVKVKEEAHKAEWKDAN